jgi:GNAT superfamily N-acetyltransferase
MAQRVETSLVIPNAPQTVRLRRGGEDDEFQTFEVMRRAMGFSMDWKAHEPTRHHLRTTEKSSFWVAEESPRWGRKRIVGYARSLVREGFWNLNEFFLTPEHQRHGIGGGLLAQCLEDGLRQGAHTRFVLASQHFGADALYMRRAGCFARVPMLLIVGSLAALPLPPQEESVIHDAVLPQLRPALSGFSSSLFAVAEPLRADPILLTPDVQAEIDALDREYVGYARPLEHALWAQEMGGAGGAARIFRRASDGKNGKIIGYGYLGEKASGPIFAVDPNDLPRMTAHLALLHRTLKPRETHLFTVTADHYFALTGTNETMLRWLLDCGWRISYHYLLMSSREFGQFAHYAITL